MQFGGHYWFKTERLSVWEALNDTKVLKLAIPGCKKIEWIGDAALELQLAVNLGFIKPVFAGDLKLSDIVPAERYTLSGRGRGGLLGLASGSADIELADMPGGTALRFTANADASNEIMALGSAIVGRSAQGVIDGFFERFASAMKTEVEPLGRD